jgi:uncharacterized repeat protein (TIGR04052 family)
MLSQLTRAVHRCTPLLPVIGLVFAFAARAQFPPGFDPNGYCVGDADGNASVTVDELVTAVDNALGGCGFVPVTLDFRAMVGPEAFACGNIYRDIGTSSVDVIPSDFRLYLHHVRLVTSDGVEVRLQLNQDGMWQHRDLALLDFEDRTPPCNQGNSPRNTSVRGMAPPGDYRGVRFVLGVPFALNHENAAIAPSPLNLTSMFWSWQAGYKFLRFDEALDQVRVHVGSTGCEYDGGNEIARCARPNRGEIHLTDFDPATDTIIADLAALFADSDLEVNHPDTPPGCMSDPGDSDCGPLLQNLGVNFANGLPDPSRQRFFRVEHPE